MDEAFPWFDVDDCYTSSPDSDYETKYVGFYHQDNIADDSSSDSSFFCIYATDDECDYYLNDAPIRYDFTHESEDYQTPQKLTRHGKPKKDQERLWRKKKFINLVKHMNANEFNCWEKSKKNKSLKANKKWNHCEISQILC